MSLGMLSGPVALPLVSLFMHLSYVARVNCVVICVPRGPLLSNMMPSCVCHAMFFLDLHVPKPRWLQYYLLHQFTGDILN
jgi:hypothetical protein